MASVFKEIPSGILVFNEMTQTKESTKARLTFSQKTYWWSLLGKWTDERTVDLSGRFGLRYMWCITNTAFYNKEHDSNSQTGWWECDGPGLLFKNNKKGMKTIPLCWNTHCPHFKSYLLSFLYYLLIFLKHVTKKVTGRCLQWHKSHFICCCLVICYHNQEKERKDVFRGKDFPVLLKWH